MTGRELIMYILQNKLEDEEVIGDNHIVGLITVGEFATKHRVGIATVYTWGELGWVKLLKFGDRTFVVDDFDPTCEVNAGG